MKSVIAGVLIGIISLIVLQLANPEILQATAVVNNNAITLTKQPYAMGLGQEKTGTLLVDINYTHGQNTTFVIAPLTNTDQWSDNRCITRMLLGTTAINTEPICKENTVDLSSELQEGVNRLTLELHSDHPEIAVYLSPKLVGTQLLSTLGCLGLLTAAAFFLMWGAHTMKLDTISGVILIFGFFYYTYWLYFFPNLQYTADVPGHLPYIIHMIDNWMRPYDYTGHESFHPPLYYFVAARIFNFFSTGPISPLTAVRAFSVVLYLLFCLFGLATLRLASGREGLAYYVGCLLIIFWPAGILKVTNISNDIAMYAVWGATFYYICRAFDERSVSHMQTAMALVGLAFMVKSNGWVPLGITGGCALYGICSGALPWRRWLSGYTVFAVLAICLGIASNFGRIIYLHLFHHQNEVMMYFGYPRADIHPWYYFVTFNLKDFLDTIFITFDHEPTYLNFFLKTMLYNEYSHRAPHILPFLPKALNILLLIWLIFTIFGAALWVIQRRKEPPAPFPFIIAAAISVLASAMFMIVDRYVFCQNFRYVLPMIVPLVVLFVRGMQIAGSYRWLKPLSWFGLASGIFLSLGAIILYLAQYIEF